MEAGTWEVTLNWGITGQYAMLTCMRRSSLMAIHWLGQVQNIYSGNLSSMYVAHT
jgi:hypothetical protein